MHDFLAVMRGGAGAQFFAERYLGDVAHVDRRAVAVRDDDVRDRPRTSSTWPGARMRYCSPLRSM